MDLLTHKFQILINQGTLLNILNRYTNILICHWLKRVLVKSYLLGDFDRFIGEEASQSWKSSEVTDVLLIQECWSSCEGSSELLDSARIVSGSSLVCDKRRCSWVLWRRRRINSGEAFSSNHCSTRSGRSPSPVQTASSSVIQLRSSAIR